MTLDQLAAVEKASDHAFKWIGIAVAILTLITLWQSYQLHKLELQQKGLAP